MRRGAHVVLALFLAGCAGGTIRVELAESPGAFGSKRMVIHEVELSPEFYGRGCLDLVIEHDRVTLAIQQDASSDWAGLRVAPMIARDIVSAALAFASAPWDLVAGLLGQRPAAPPGPSTIHGCEGLLED